MSDDERSTADELPKRLGAVLKADPRYIELVERGEPDPDPSPRCATCGDIGYLRHDVLPGDPLFGRLVVCACKAPSLVKARVDRLWSGSQAPAHYAGYTLDSYPGEPEAVASLRAWIAREKSWLVLSGEHGAGKTGLCVACLRIFAELGRSVLFVNAPSMLRRVRATYSTDRESESAVIDTLADVDVLAIDDVGKERLSEWATELLYDVVNRRYSADLRTIVTTNLSMHELNAHVGDATFWRIYERAEWLNLSGNLRRRRGRRG